MTFKKINDDKLIITFHSMEMPEFANLDDFVTNTNEVRDVFVRLLEEARDKVGFDANDYTINVDTKVTLNDDVVIEITKLPNKTRRRKAMKDSKNNFDEAIPKKDNSIKKGKIAKAKPVKKKVENNAKEAAPSVNLDETVLKAKPKKVIKQADGEYLIYKFDAFDDFVDFCLLLKHSNINVNVKKISKECILYSYNGKYYLSLKDVNEAYKNIATFYTGVTEFSTFCLNSDVLHLLLIEHGETFIKNNAVETVMKSLK